MISKNNLEERKQSFLKKAREKWGDKFSYDLSNYVSDGTCITITDNETGEVFEFQPRNHLRSSTGKPVQTDIGKKRGYTQEKFISIVKEKFGDKLDLSEAVYKGSGELVKVTCVGHKLTYFTRAALLMHGYSGCPACAVQNMKDSSYTRKVNWDDQTIINTLKELVSSGKTFEEIGKLFGVTGHQVGVIVKKYNIELPDIREEEKKQLIELLKDGKSVSDLAKIYNVTYQAIWYKIKSFGIENYVSKYIFDPESIDKDYIEEQLMSGKTVIGIAESLGITRDKLQRSIDFYGIDIWKKKRLDEASDVEKIRELANKGYLCSSISKETGIYYDKIKYLAEINDIELPKWETNSYTKEDLEKYVAEGLSIQEIADVYYGGVDPSAVLNALKRYGVEHQDNRLVSVGELYVTRFLENTGLEFKQQVRISGEFEGRNSNIVIIDFVLPSKNIWIEYNGKQHYEYCPHFHNNNIEGFRKQVERDRNLRNYCMDRNICLIEVPYILDNFQKISEFLTNTVLSGVSPNTLIDYKSLYKNEI